MARRILGSRICRTMTAASEFVPGDASAAQTCDNGKWTAPNVKETNTVRTRSRTLPPQPQSHSWVLPERSLGLSRLQGHRRVQDTCQLFQGIDEARAGPLDGLGDKKHSAFLHRPQILPTGETLELLRAGRKRLGLGQEDHVGILRQQLLQG